MAPLPHLEDSRASAVGRLESARNWRAMAADETSALRAAIFGSDSESDDEPPPPPAPTSTAAQVARVLQEAGVAQENKTDEPNKGKQQDQTQTTAAPTPDNAGQQDPAPGDDAESEYEEEEAGALEAIEEGGKHDLDHIIKNMKKRRGGIQRSREALVADVQDIQMRMDVAAQADDDACTAEVPAPAVHKVSMLPDVVNMLRKRHMHEIMIDLGMLSNLSHWLRPMPDGSLVSLQIRTQLLNHLKQLEVDETVLGSLRSSGIGKFVKMYSLHPRETAANKHAARYLIEKWSRPIFQTSVTFAATEVPKVVPIKTAADLLDEEKPLGIPEEDDMDEVVAQKRLTVGGTHVPLPMGMDFAAQPVSSSKPLPSSKYAKDSVKGRLHEKLLGKRKGRSGASQVKLSIEGRNMDL